MPFAVVDTCRDVTMMLLVLSLIYVYTSAQAYVINAVVSPPERITCWTCPYKADNEACNDWAPDKFCPLNHTICRTTHRVNTLTGKSIKITKECTYSKDCTADMIGCHPTDVPGVKDCVSCCNFAYCNEMAPTNYTTAIMFSSLPTSGAPSQGHWTMTLERSQRLVLFSVLVLTLTHTLAWWASGSEYQLR